MSEFDIEYNENETKINIKNHTNSKDILEYVLEYKNFNPNNDDKDNKFLSKLEERMNNYYNIVFVRNN